MKKPESMDAAEQQAYKEGWKAAMNSPEVREMYEKLKDIGSWFQWDAVNELVASYAEGLKEVSDGIRPRREAQEEP